MTALAWCLNRFGILGTAIMGALFAVVLYLLFAVGYQYVTGYFDRHKLDKVTDQRDTAIAERDVAKTNAANADTSADAAQAARATNDTRLPAVRKATAEAVQRATRDIEQTPALPGARLGPDQLHDDAEAAARYRSAASRLRGTGAR